MGEFGHLFLDAKIRLIIPLASSSTQAKVTLSFPPGSLGGVIY